MPYNFKTLDRQRFEKLVNQILVRAKGENVKPVHGAGGDEGIDCFVGQFSGDKEVYQHKFFCDSIGPSQRKQIENSMNRALSKHKITKWFLVLPKDLTPNEHRWFESFQKKFHSVEIEIIGASWLTDMLLKNKDISDKFFPELKIMQEMKRVNVFWKKAFASLQQEGSLKSKYDIIPRVKQMGICRLNVIGATASVVAKCLYSLYPNERGVKFGVVAPIKKDKEMHSRLVLRKGKISFELETDGDEPFHLVYPRIDSVDIVLGDIDIISNSSFVVAFSASKSFRDFLKMALTQALESNVRIEEATLDTKMKTLVGNYAHAIDTLRFDPAIIEKIKQEGGKEIETHLRRETLYGDPGLPNMAWVQRALASVQRVRRGQISDIMFFRARHAAHFDKEHIITFEVHHDGRVRAFFPAHKFVTVDSMKIPLRAFSDKWL